MVVSENMSSSNTLSRKILDQIHEEVTDHMKRSGVFDELRTKLIEPIWTDDIFRNVKDQYEFECEKFCRQADMGLNRNVLRSRLAERLDIHSKAAQMAKQVVRQFLSEREKDLKDSYYKHACEFLTKFIPTNDSPTKSEAGIYENSNDRVSDGQAESMDYEDIEQSNDMDSHRDLLDAEEERQVSEDMDLGSDDDDDIPRPEYSPIASDQGTYRDHNNHEDPESNQNQVTPIGITIDEVRENSELRLAAERQDRDNQETDKPECDNDQLALSFSDVSSVRTGDLTDFEDSINLSDDEADLVGHPEGNKLKLDQLLQRINGLQSDKELDTNEDDTKSNSEIRSMDKIEKSIKVEKEPEKDTEDTSKESRRRTRERKSNPRYNNDDYMTMLK